VYRPANADPPARRHLFPNCPFPVKSRSKRPNGNSEGKVQRISVSLPESVFCELDQLVAERGWESRSKAISVMVTQSALEHREDQGDTLMAGTITIVYDESKGNLLQRLAELERRYLDEVISSLHVQLENDHRIEVLLVQGPAGKLQNIADQLLTLKGVKTGKLTLTTMLMPPLHPLPPRVYGSNQRSGNQGS
jgi:CopG family transcriptional regulator, nickel-responsive regulator